MVITDSHVTSMIILVFPSIMIPDPFPYLKHMLSTRRVASTFVLALMHRSSTPWSSNTGFLYNAVLFIGDDPGRPSVVLQLHITDGCQGSGLRFSFCLSEVKARPNSANLRTQVAGGTLSFEDKCRSQPALAHLFLSETSFV